MKRTQLFMKIAAIAACLAAPAFLIVGAVKHWAWAGFDKPLYDWMQLLIIPVVLALIAVWFNRIDKKNELTIAQKRAEDERTLAIDNQQEAALQSYLDKLSELLLDRHLRTLNPNDEAYHEVRNVARVRTLTMLYQLNIRRTNYMLAFLRELELITADPRTTIITFRQTDLHDADLSEINLSQADLSFCNLEEANLKGADLSFCNLKEVNLKGANLHNTDLSFSELKGANLSGAKIDKLSLDKSTATKEQIATMKIVSL